MVEEAYLRIAFGIEQTWKSKKSSAILFSETSVFPQKYLDIYRNQLIGALVNACHYSWFAHKRVNFVKIIENQGINVDQAQIIYHITFTNHLQS